MITSCTFDYNVGQVASKSLIEVLTNSPSRRKKKTRTLPCGTRERFVECTQTWEPYKNQ